MDREYRDNRAGRGGGHGINPNNPNPHLNRHYSRREFYASQRNSNTDFNNNNLNSSKPVGTWRTLMKRQEDLANEKTHVLKDLGLKQEETEKANNKRYSELRKNERESIREKVEERESVNMKEEMLKFQRDELSLLTENDASLPPTSSTENTVVEARKEELRQQEKVLELEKCNIIDALMRLEAQFSSQEKKLTKEILEQKQGFEKERFQLLERYGIREKKLDGEIQRFCLDFERQLSELDKGSRYDHNFTRYKVLERDIMQRDQTIQHIHSYILELEQRHRGELERIQQVNSDLHFENGRLLQQLENERESIISKSKMDGISEYLRGEWNGFISYGSVHGVTNCSGLQTTAGHPFGHNPDSTPPSPCCQTLRTPDGGVLTDLRDRYEDLKVKATFSSNEKLWSLAMIRSIVMHYEGLGMRLYEESSKNKYVSTLMSCPNAELFPNKMNSTFATGWGDTEEEATENAVQWAYSAIHTATSTSEQLQPLEEDLNKLSEQLMIQAELPDENTPTVHAYYSGTHASQTETEDVSRDSQTPETQQPYRSSPGPDQSHTRPCNDTD